MAFKLPSGAQWFIVETRTKGIRATQWSTVALFDLSRDADHFAETIRAEVKHSVIKIEVRTRAVES